MKKETLIALLALSWSIVVTAYAFTLTTQVATLSKTISDLRVLLENATRTIRSLRRDVGGLGNASIIEVRVIIHGPISRNSTLSLRKGASALDAVAEAARVAVEDGKIVSIDGVKGVWKVYVQRRGERVVVVNVARFALEDGDTVEVALAGSNN